MARKRRDPRKPDAVDVSVGANLRTWRIARGLTQADLAKRLGITFQQVQKYEIGHNRISTGRLAKAAVILGLPMSAFFQGVGDRLPSQALLANARAYRLAHAFAAINNSTLRLSLVGLVEQLASVVPRESKQRRRRRGK